jgi:hypothetical protein
MWTATVLFLSACATHLTHSQLLTAMIIEPQLSLTLVDSLLNARAHLKHEYPIVLLTLPQNWPFFEQPIWHALNVRLLRNETVPAIRQEYSDKLTGCQFWNHFDSEFVLIFQADSRFCSSSPHSIEQFMMLRLPYLGAPWLTNGGVGNGGFSLRLLAATRDACNNSARGYHEDSYFTEYFRTHAKRWPNAPLTTAEKFASETYYPLAQAGAPLGIHKAYAYQKDGRLRTVCPEFDLLKRVKT